MTDLTSGDSVHVTFQVPGSWVPGGNNLLNLTFDYFATSGGNQSISTPLTAILRVQFDSELAASFILSNTGGKQNLNVPLRLGLLGNPTRHTHAVRVTLDTSENCQVSQTAGLSFHDDLSYFHFEYHEGSPARDLPGYPQPFSNHTFRSHIY